MLHYWAYFALLILLERIVFFLPMYYILNNPIGSPFGTYSELSYVSGYGIKDIM